MADDYDEDLEMRSMLAYEKEQEEQLGALSQSVDRLKALGLDPRPIKLALGRDGRAVRVERSREHHASGRRLGYQ